MQEFLKSAGTTIPRGNVQRVRSPRASPRQSPIRNTSIEKVQSEKDIPVEEPKNNEEPKPKKVSLKINLERTRIKSSSERQIHTDRSPENRNQTIDNNIFAPSKTFHSPRAMAMTTKVIPYNFPRLTSHKGSSPLITKRNEYGEIDINTVYKFDQLLYQQGADQQPHPHPYNNFLFPMKTKNFGKRSGSVKQAKPHFEDDIIDRAEGTKFDFAVMILKMNSMKFVPIKTKIQTVPNTPEKSLPPSDNINFKRSRPGYVRNQYGNFMKF